MIGRGQPITDPTSIATGEIVAVRISGVWHEGIAPADVFRLGAYVDGARVAVALMGEATAPGLSSSEVWEVTRVCVGPGAPRYTASRILGACGRVMDGAGVQLGISYTRVDERGSSYLAAGWVPAALVRGRAHTSGNRALRMLPGLYEPSTEIVDRVRWERGPRAARVAGVRWDGGRWLPGPTVGQQRK